MTSDSPVKTRPLSRRRRGPPIVLYETLWLNKTTTRSCFTRELWIDGLKTLPQGKFILLQAA